MSSHKNVEAVHELPLHFLCQTHFIAVAKPEDEWRREAPPFVSCFNERGVKYD
jgi:hypothetical protein